MINYVENIKKANISIYNTIEMTDEKLFIPTEELQSILSEGLLGFSLKGLPLRTRSKVVKSKICTILGYPIPASFKKTQPRFLGQKFDVYTQKSLNVQIWNEDVDANRRYVFLRVNCDDEIIAVRVIIGEELAKLDKTGTLTRKYQATMKYYGNNICSNSDTDAVTAWTANGLDLSLVNPNQLPKKGEILAIKEVFTRLLPLVGKSVNYMDALQERNRGANLHSLICKLLGYSYYSDDGSYPDIANQLLEIKLQTSPTIDLGLHAPDDGQQILSLEDGIITSEDIRYVVIDAEQKESLVLLNKLYVVTGKDFASYFPLFKGKVTNAKIQIPLPNDFFN